jgi:hypothetical protein
MVDIRAITWWNIQNERRQSDKIETEVCSNASTYVTLIWRSVIKSYMHHLEVLKRSLKSALKMGGRQILKE